MAVPTDDQSYVQILRQSRANLAQTVQTETASWAASGGAKPSYSLDGRSVSWTEWLTAMRAAMQALDAQIQYLDQPYEIHVRCYT